MLNTPFPKPQSSRKKILFTTLVGFGVSLFIIFYKPFGIENVNKQWYFDLVILSLGLVFILSFLFMEVLIPKLFPKIFQNWTLAKAIVWYGLLIIIVGAAVFLYKSYLQSFHDFTLKEFSIILGRTLLMALTIFFCVIGIYQYINRQKLSLVSSQEIYPLLLPNGDTLPLMLKDILFISSNDNYVDIHYEEEGIRKKLLCRSSLKNIESQLVNPFSPILRCHRKFLINADRFSILKTSSRSMLISLKKYEDEIPVSKQYAEKISQALQIHP
ncbi:MAG: LytTR family transcriptional regulator DNA-binding domain-containing protein [Bacteroidota bacterium]